MLAMPTIFSHDSCPLLPKSQKFLLWWLYDSQTSSLGVATMPDRCTQQPAAHLAQDDCFCWNPQQHSHWSIYWWFSLFSHFIQNINVLILAATMNLLIIIVNGLIWALVSPFAKIYLDSSLASLKKTLGAILIHSWIKHFKKDCRISCSVECSS